MSDIISEAFEVRTNSDYDDYYVVSKKAVLEQVNKAEYFYKEIKQYIDEKFYNIIWNKDIRMNTPCIFSVLELENIQGVRYNKSYA